MPIHHPAAAFGPTSLAERVLQTMPWGILALSHQGVLRLLNPYAAQLLGYPAGYDETPLLGQPLSQALPPAFPEALRTALHEAHTATSPVTGEFFLPSSQRWLAMTTAPGEEEVLVYWQDVTRLITKRQQYQALADNTPDAVARWDADLCLRYANPAMETKVGQPLAVLLGKTLREVGIPAAIEEPYSAAMQRVFDTGQPQRHLTLLPTPQGEQHYQTRLVPELHDGYVHTVLTISHNITELKQAEAELRQSHHLLQAVFDSSTLGLNVLRSVRDEEGRLLDLEVVLANATAQAIAGAQPVVGRRLEADWPHTRAIGLFERVLHTVETGEPLDMEHYFDADGLRAWFRWTAVQLDDGAVMAVEDITARREAEEQLRQAHAQLSAVFEAVPVQLGYYHAVRDDQGQLVDLRAAAVNAASVVRMGLASYSSGQLMSSQLPNLRELPVWQRMKEVIETGQPQRLELYHEFNSATVWFDVLYTRLGDGLINASLDITERRQMEQQLRESHDLLQAVFDATLDSLEVLHSVRDETGQLIDFEWMLTNEAAHRLAGRSDLVGRRLLAEEPAMRESGVFERLRQVVAQGQATDFEQHYPYDGSDEWYHVAAAPLGDGVVVNWQNITARRQATAELLRLQLTQQQQLANAVLAAQEVERRRIAESLHNGLGQQLYAAKLHLDALVATADAPAFAAGKHQTGQLLVQAIEHVRTLSDQLIPTVLEDFGLAAAMRDICRNYRQPQLQLHCAVAELPPLPLPLSLALYRMAQELVKNLAQHADATEAHLSLRAHEGWVELRATDKGRGFDSTQPRLTGLGLNAVRDRVKLLSGELTIVSSPAHGTDVTIRVPYGAEAAVPRQ